MDKLKFTKDEVKAPMGVGANWSPEKRGRALLFIWTLANSHHTNWKSKAQLWSEFQEFKD